MGKHRNSLLMAVSFLAFSGPGFVQPANAQEGFSGLYGGIGGGGRFLFGNLQVEAIPAGMMGSPENNDFGSPGAFGTLELGHDWGPFEGPAVSGLVFGVFGNFDFGKNDGSITQISMSVEIKVGDWDINYSFGVGGRVGILGTPNTLFYATSGFTMMDIESVIFTTPMGMGAPAPTSVRKRDLVPGFFVGAGVETMLSDRISTKLEYRFSTYAQSRVFTGVFPGSMTVPTVNKGSAELDNHAIRATLVYRFGNLFGDSSSAALEDPEITPTAGGGEGFSGLYGSVGGGGRFLFGNLQVESNPAGMMGNHENNDFGSPGAFGTLELGHDWGPFEGPAVSGLVVGVVGNFDFGKNDGTITNVTMSVEVKVGDWDINYSFGIGGRVGILGTPNTLFYATSGFTMMDIESVISTTPMSISQATSVSKRELVPGFFVGAGVETMVTDTLAAKLEYRFSSYAQSRVFTGVFPGSMTVPTVNRGTAELDNHAVRATLVYRFGNLFGD